MSKKNRPSNRLAGPVLLVSVISKPSKNWQPFLKELMAILERTGGLSAAIYLCFNFVLTTTVTQKNREQQRGSPRDNHRLDQQLQCELYNMNNVHDLPNGFYIFIITTDPIVYELPSILPFHPKLSKSTHLQVSTHSDFTFISQLVLWWQFPTS